MTVDEFDEKYKDYLEEDFDGLMINDVNVINYLDEKFQEFIKIPGFKFQQIKLKFGKTRFYAEPEEINTFAVEEEIDKILKSKQ